MWWTKTGVNSSYGNVISVKEDMVFHSITVYGHAEVAAVRPVITISKNTLNTLTNTSPILDAQTFCENKGYNYGMIYGSTYELGWSEEGDINDSYYLCADEENFECDVYGYDVSGTLVYSLTGGCTVEQ